MRIVTGAIIDQNYFRAGVRIIRNTVQAALYIAGMVIEGDDDTDQRRNLVGHGRVS
jgi:hypothetical protein